MTECNNKSRCHRPEIIREDENAIRVVCLDCRHTYILRKDYRGVVENRAYSKIFKRDILQGNDNLYYKYYPTNLRT